MACHRRKAAAPAWGRLYLFVAVALAGLALGEMFAPHARFRLIADSVGVLLLFGGMRIWLGANRARLALDGDTWCCTSRLTVRVVEPAAVPENEADELELVTEATWLSRAPRVT